MDADELVRAIRAALDETERIALASQQASSTPWRAAVGYDPAVYDALNCAVARYTEVYPETAQPMIDDDAVHIAHNDPAAVLRRVAADREIVERCEQYARWAANDEAPGFQALKAAGEHMLRVLARGLGINPEEETR